MVECGKSKGRRRSSRFGAGLQVDPCELLKVLVFFCCDHPTSLIQALKGTGCISRVYNSGKKSRMWSLSQVEENKTEMQVSKEGNVGKKRRCKGNPHSQPAKDNRNILKSLKRIQKLSRCGCFLLVFTWKNTLKSDKSTENSSGGSLSWTSQRACSK